MDLRSLTPHSCDRSSTRSPCFLLERGPSRPKRAFRAMFDAQDQAAPITTNSLCLTNRDTPQQNVASDPGRIWPSRRRYFTSPPADWDRWACTACEARSSPGSAVRPPGRRLGRGVRYHRPIGSGGRGRRHHAPTGAPRRMSLIVSSTTALYPGGMEGVGGTPKPALLLATDRCTG